MRIAVISDLHIGPPGLDFLDHSDDSFISFLKNLESSHEKIILLGDIIETLMPKYPGGFEENFWRAWFHRRAITSRFEHPQYTYVYGNHDWIASKLVHAKERLYIHSGGRRMLFVHGHQLDRLYNKNVGESLVYALGWGVRGGLGKLYRKLAYLETARHARMMFITKEMKKIISETNSNTLITGHSHSAMIKNFGDILYLNSGHCAFGNKNFLSMDLENDHFCIEKL